MNSEPNGKLAKRMPVWQMNSEPKGKMAEQTAIGLSYGLNWPFGFRVMQACRDLAVHYLTCHTLCSQQAVICNACVSDSTSSLTRACQGQGLVAVSSCGTSLVNQVPAA